ncbi:MAG: rhodanese-like domain-containing protein [Gemmatimonadales bacterium]
MPSRLLQGAALLLLAAPGGAQLPTGERLLTTPAWLSAHLNDRDLVVLHVGRAEAYAREHIAGTRLAVRSDFASDEMPLLEMLPEAQLRRSLERLGIGDGSRIVVVSDGESLADATRIFFTLGFAGLGERTLFLDGGLPAWKEAHQPVTTAVPEPATKARLTSKFLPAVVVDAALVGTLGSKREPRLVDARAAIFFNGPKGDMEAAGHIAGAVNLPFNSLVSESGKLLPRAILAERFAAAGIAPTDSLVVYCHIGQQATVVLLAARVLGHEVKLYDGSFHDWSNRNLPTERSPAANGKSR